MFDEEPEDSNEAMMDYHAQEDIKKDGLKNSIVNSIDKMIEESIALFACNCLGQTANYDPKIGLEYARMKLKKCLDEIEKQERHDAQDDE